MKNQPQNGVGYNFLKRLGGVIEVTHSPSKKQSARTGAAISPCRCKGDNAPSSLSINFTDGMYDAEDLRRDLSAIDLLRRYQRRMRSGYCRICANEYIRAFFLKLDMIDQRENSNGL